MDCFKCRGGGGRANCCASAGWACCRCSTQWGSGWSVWVSVWVFFCFLPTASSAPVHYRPKTTHRFPLWLPQSKAFASSGRSSKHSESFLATSRFAFSERRGGVRVGGSIASCLSAALILKHKMLQWSDNVRKGHAEGKKKTRGEETMWATTKKSFHNQAAITEPAASLSPYPVSACLKQARKKTKKVAQGHAIWYWRWQVYHPTGERLRQRKALSLWVINIQSESGALDFRLGREVQNNARFRQRHLIFFLKNSLHPQTGTPCDLIGLE